MKRKEEVVSEDEDAADESPCWQKKPQEAEQVSKKRAELSDDEDVDPEDVKVSKKVTKQLDQDSQLFISGLPRDIDVKELVEHLAEVGPVKHTFFVKGKDGKPRGSAFVTFRNVEEAGVAIDRFNNTKLKENTIKVSRAMDKKSKNAPPTDDWSEFKENRSVVVSNVPDCYRNNVDRFRQWIEKAMPSSGLQQVRIRDEGGLSMTLSFKSTDSVARAVIALDGAKVSNGQALKCIVKSISMQQGSARAGRIMFRNLSWAVKDDVLRKECSAFGKVTEVAIPSKPNGEKKGFGFVQFATLEEANKAIAALNGKKIKGRAVAVDIAVDKRLYGNLKALKAPENTQRTEEVLPAALEDSLLDMDIDMDSAKVVDEKTEKKMDRKAKDLAKSMNSQQDEDDEIDRPKEEKEKKESGFDVDNRTLFVRNIAFEATTDDVKEAFSKHGRVLYCKLVLNHETGKHKGTGFVKYADPKFAKKCMQEEELNKHKMQAIFKAPAKSSIALEGLGISIKGRKVHILPALKPEESMDSRQEQEKVEKKSKKECKKQWMHLLHVGYLEDDDMHKQEKQAREDVKKERTYRGRNPNFEINPYQLTVRNLPGDVASTHVNEQVKKFLTEELKYAKKDARAVFDNCVIVREKSKQVDAQERESLGFGFVRFRDHNVAFKVLHHLNGNSKLPWSHVKRPIVEFTIEDKRKLKQIEVTRKKTKESERKKATKRPRWGGEQAAQEKTEEWPEAKKQKTGRGAKQREKRRQTREKAGLQGVEAPGLPKTKKLFERFAKAPKPEKEPKAKVVRENVPATHVSRRVIKEQKRTKKGLSDDFEVRALAKMRSS